MLNNINNLYYVSIEKLHVKNFNVIKLKEFYLFIFKI